MHLPKPGRVVAALVLALILVAIGLALAQDQETLRIQTSVAAGDPVFPSYLARLLGNPFTRGDAVIVHTDGDDAFPAMLEAIGNAKTRISFETYVYDASDIAAKFSAAFAAAAQRGVTVRMVLDSIGAKTIRAAGRERMEQAGVKIGWYNPLASYSIEEANYRTHRKILVIDGDVAFIGGMGIGEHWSHDTEKFRRWRDTMMELRGGVALNIEAGFNENWIETGGVVDPDLTPHGNDRPGRAESIVVWSSPQGGANEMKLLYLMAIAAARRTIDVQSPYLITDESTKWSLTEARKRGVHIRLLVEGDVTDAKPVKFASRADYAELMAGGIEIFEYQPSMMHAKAMIVDGVLSIFGSANFDNRSLELNDELNAAVFDRELAARLEADFNRDTTRSKKLNLDEWRARPPHIRAREWAWSYFGEIF
jgi:cardiolipin synthase